ncbi:hypothetical protein [Pseudonocardia sp. TRM90224]|uniref:hypothetical protein n=1 Tax=Pseudonocardia sp. TRM90224 TaxID=2812678 RepID=UPI001E4FB0E2|nr:hypothetical protein [Pseudonocardia sp. TRM90224]
MGIGVHRADTAGVAMAQQVIESWRSAWRTRRAVVAPDGACSGSGSCPHVEMAQAQLDVFTQRGDHAVVIGGQGPDRVGTTSVGSVRAVAELTADPDRLAYLVQPGFVAEDAAPIVAALRSRFPHIRGAHPDNICYGPSDRRLSLRILASTCDIVLVVGTGRRAGPPDPDVTAMPGWAVIHEITDASELQPEWLKPAESVGVVARAGSDAGVIQQVVDSLSGLGPLSVARRGVVTELVAGPLSRHHLHIGAVPAPTSETLLEFATAPS